MRAYVARYSKHLSTKENSISYLPNVTPRAMLLHYLQLLDAEFNEAFDIGEGAAVREGYEFSLNNGRNVHGRVLVADGSPEQNISEVVLAFEGSDPGLDKILRRFSFFPVDKYLIHQELLEAIGYEE